MAYVGRDPQTVFGEYKKIDVSGWSFDSSTTTFPAGFQIGDVNQVMLSINGIIQEPTTDFLLTAGGTNIVFTSAPETDDSCFAIVGGNVAGVAHQHAVGSVTADALSANLKTFDEFRVQADGTSDSYTMSYSPSSKGSLLVTVDGVVQASANFSLVGRSISFDSNLDSGAFLRVVDYGHKAGVFIPVDGSVTQGKLADDAVQVQNLDSSLVYTNIPIRVNTQNISVPFTIDSSKNASVIGPITVDSNVTITVNGNFTIV